MKIKFAVLLLVGNLLSLSVFGQNFTLQDPEHLFSKKEKAIFEHAVNYEFDFFHRIFPNENVNFSQLTFTIVPNSMQYMLYQTKIMGAVKQHSAGVYVPALHEVVVCKDKKYKETFLSTSFHELSHAVLHLHASDKYLPAWLNEGLADYMGQMNFSSKKVKHRVHKHRLLRVKTLIELQEINLAEFMTWSYQKFSHESFSQEGYGYAIGYAMVLLIMQINENEAITLIRNLIGNYSPVEVFDKYYAGGFAQFEKDFMEKYQK